MVDVGRLGPEDLLQAREVAALLHVGPASVRDLMHRHQDFPRPVKTAVARGGRVHLWLRDDVIEWGAPRGYLGPTQHHVTTPPAPRGPLRVRRALPHPRRYARRAG